MATQPVCILGGTGFVGRHITRLLCANGTEVRLPTRSTDKAQQALAALPVEAIAADVHDPAQLKELFAGAGAIINLVGILHEQGGQTFRQAHIELARKVVEAAKAAGVNRLLHMSALNASADGPSNYLRSKGEAEKLVQASGLQATIFRPSVIFGAEDTFLNMFAKLAKWAPVMPLACANAKFQPVWVENVAQAFVHSLDDPASIGQRYNLCGPQVYRLRELVSFAAACCDRHPLIVPLPNTIAYAQASVMEWLPVKLMTRDNFNSMRQDNVCDCAFPFGIKPARMEDIAPRYLCASKNVQPES
ncbi:MAG: complex I NDUFA9 subunit family protein [Gallionellaceae bacterium]|nr:complex I NDUFA9 subunit family protein [Gallionellaceae bacterium]